MAPRAKYDQVTNNCSASKPMQFTGRKSSHRFALETRSNGLDKLRLAGRGKKRLLVSELLKLFAVPLPDLARQSGHRACFIYRSCFPCISPCRPDPTFYGDELAGATVFGLSRARRMVRMVSMLGECAAVNYKYPIGFYIQPYRTL